MYRQSILVTYGSPGTLELVYDGFLKHALTKALSVHEFPFLVGTSLRT